MPTLDFVAEGDQYPLRGQNHEQLPDRLAQAQTDAWVLLTSIRPLQHHEDEQVQGRAFDATTALIGLLRALNKLDDFLLAAPEGGLEAKPGEGTKLISSAERTLAASGGEIMVGDEEVSAP